MSRRLSILLLCAGAGLALAGGQAVAQPAAGHEGADGLAGLSFLVGEWEGAGGGAPGQGAGSFSFGRELQQKVLVRHNHADYPAAQGRPALAHDDLMVVYGEGEGRPLQAIYFDSEGHVIQYRVQVEKSAERATAVFVSDPVPGSPRFRLTYRTTGPDTLDLKFEIALPGKPDAFSQYIAASARRKGRTGTVG